MWDKDEVIKAIARENFPPITVEILPCSAAGMSIEDMRKAKLQNDQREDDLYRLGIID